YAAEALAIILTYNRSFIAPGSALGMGAVLADQLAPFRHAGFYDKRLASLLTAGAGGFRQRYLDQLGITEPPVVVRPLAPPPPPPRPRSGSRRGDRRRCRSGPGSGSRSRRWRRVRSGTCSAALGGGGKRFAIPCRDRRGAACPEASMHRRRSPRAQAS